MQGLVFKFGRQFSLEVTSLLVIKLCCMIADIGIGKYKYFILYAVFFSNACFNSLPVK